MYQHPVKLKGTDRNRDLQLEIEELKNKFVMLSFSMSYPEIKF